MNSSVKKINLVSIPNGLQNPETPVMLSKTQELLDKNKKVIILTCIPKKKSHCAYNIFGQQNICTICKKNKKFFFSKLNGEFEIFNFKDIKLRKKKKLSSLSKVLSYKYKDCEIGISSYASYTNTTRDSDLEGKLSYETINKLVNDSIKVLLSFKKISKKYKFSSINLFNGRFHNQRPILNICNKKNMNLNVFEFSSGRNDKTNKGVFIFKTLSNDPNQYIKLSNHIWRKNIKKINLAHNFFKFKSLGKVVDDVKSYTSSQNQNKLPANWNDKNHNIVIFTSSDDEFKTGSLNYNKNAFQNQYETIKKIAKISLEDKNIKIWVREHPNLNKVFWKYKKKLYEIKSKNLEIIKSNSDISTYKLMFNCNKVITFASVTSVEALYWRKPSIILGRISHEKFEGFHVPKNYKVLKKLILNKALKPGKKIGALKYGLFRSSGGIKFKGLLGNQEVGYRYKKYNHFTKIDKFKMIFNRLKEKYYFNYFINYLMRN